MEGEPVHLPLSPVLSTRARLKDHDARGDEPELPSPIAEQAVTPLPRAQMAILLLLLLCEPVSAFVIYPFLAQLVGELEITKGDKSAIGYYVGIIESLFYLAQGLTVLQWGLLSDRIGRRPVILFGQLGLAASLLTFGFSSTFGWIIFGRSLAGFLDGNVGVVKTMLGELTDDTNRARAFSLFPCTWIAGATLAPLVGGALQHPSERFPSVFGKSEFWKRYPYLLPCLCAAALCIFTFFAGAAGLKETLVTKSPKTPLNAYQSLAQDTPIDEEFADDEEPKVYRPPSVRDVFVRPVLAAVLNYGTLAMLDIAYFAIITVFFAVPVKAGGLGYSPPRIGTIFAAIGIASGSVQMFLFPAIHKRFGARRILRWAVTSFFIVFPLFPLMHIAAKSLGPDSVVVWGLILLLVCTNPLIDMGYSCSFMFVTTSSPAPNLLGSVNGLAQTVVSMVRALGPAGATALFSLSTNNGWMGGYAIYVIMCALTAGALLSTLLLPESGKSTPKGKGK